MNTMIKVGDIDIDVADRAQVLKYIQHIAASIEKEPGQWTRHNTGIYVTPIPVNPITGTASIDYQTAEARGYTKIDILNNSVYTLINNRQHLKKLVEKDPDWSKLNDPEFFQKVVHIGNHYNLYQRLAEPISSLEQMAMFLALIRPAKRHLVGLTWNQISESIWEKSIDGVYAFKKSHSFAYSMLVIVHMNLLCELQN